MKLLSTTAAGAQPRCVYWADRRTFRNSCCRGELRIADADHRWLQVFAHCHAKLAPALPRRSKSLALVQTYRRIASMDVEAQAS
jgi:hypothetical protein